MRTLFFFLIAICGIRAEGAYVVGICGGSCSGKTTFSSHLRKALGDQIAYIPQDAYFKEFNHLSPEKKREINYDHPDVIDFALFCAHVRALKEGNAVCIPNYSFKTDSREPGGRIAEPRRVILVDGHLIYTCPELKELIDLKVYIDTENDIRCIRRVIRDLSLDRGIENTANQYLENISPMYESYVLPMRREADIIIEGSKNRPNAVETIVAKLKEHL